MSSNPLRLQHLFQLYLNDSGTKEELDEFWKLVSQLDEEADDPLKNDLWHLWYNSDAENQSGKKDLGNMLQKIQLRAGDWEKKQSPAFLRIPFQRVAAAIVILILGIGAYFLLPDRNIKELSKKETQDHLYKNDVSPGGNKAVLTLSNGTKILLGNAANGTLAQQGNTKIIKLNNGQLSYSTSTQSSADKDVVMQYNTLTTPRGGQYHVTLPDGTQVWLNAASSLHYPTTFLGKERKVEITGEAYFEVAHNADKPFKVEVNGMQIEVLGTHFNINAYSDEPVMRTTLLQGSIKFISGNDTRLLSPGQQIQVQPNGQIKRIKDADIEQTIAWKNGAFSFHNTSIYEIMRQISRWYNVDVNFNDSLKLRLNGSIEREVKVSEVFKMIELTGEVKFNIEGRRITVFKNSK
jgi:ferric-dicitrate binding protein FerR (iron transport regulator)